MRKLLFLLLVAVSIGTEAQDISKRIDSMDKQLKKDIAYYDSSRRISDSLMTVSNKRYDSAELARSMEQNSRNLVSFMNERDRNQKKGMWMRLTFGGVLLVAGVFGMMRKRKKKDTQ